MFKVQAGSVDEYFAADPAREADLRAIDEVVRAAAPSLERGFFGGTGDGRAGMSMKLIGYGRFQYTVKSSDSPIDWPVIGLALQKNNLSLYVSAVDDGVPVVEEYADRLGKVSVSGGSVRFKAAGDVNGEVLAELANAIEVGLREGSLDLRYGRVKS